MIGVLALLSISGGALLAAARVFGRFYNPVTLYVLPWLICSLFAAMGLFRIIQPAEPTLLVISVSTAGFAVGAIAFKDLFESASLDKSESKDIVNGSSSSFANRVVTATCTIATMLSVIYISRTVPLLLEGQSFEYIKFQYSNAVGATLFSTTELLFFQWVIIPIYYTAFILFSYDLSLMVLNIRAMLFSVIGMAVIVFVSGGRNSIFVFLVICVMGLFCSKERKSIWAIAKGLPHVVKIAAVIAVLVLVYITQERSLSDDAGVLENVFFYFAGAIRYLDFILTHPSLFSIGSGLFYGRGLLGFIVNPIDVICSAIFGYSYQGTDSLVSASAAQYVPFSDELSGNALCTCIYTFIRDFGVIGIFVGPVLYGALSSFVWGKAFAKDGNGSPCWTCIWIFYAYCLVFSVWRYTLIFSATGVAFFFIAIAFSAPRRKMIELPSGRRQLLAGKRSSSQLPWSSK